MRRVCPATAPVILAVLVLTGCTEPRSAPSVRPSGATTAGSTTPARPTTTSTPAPGQRVTVTHVSDGDTFNATRADGVRLRVRLLGIDAPEVGDDDTQPQCGAAQATKALSGLVAGRRVHLVGDPRADKVDRFGRYLSYVEVDGTDVAFALVTAGMAAAWYPRGEPMPQRFPAYQDAEDAARAARTGLWRTCPTIGR